MAKRKTRNSKNKRVYRNRRTNRTVEYCFVEEGVTVKASNIREAERKLKSLLVKGGEKK